MKAKTRLCFRFNRVLVLFNCSFKAYLFWNDVFLKHLKNREISSLFQLTISHRHFFLLLFSILISPLRLTIKFPWETSLEKNQKGWMYLTTPENKIKPFPLSWCNSSWEGRYQLIISKPAVLLNNFTLKCWINEFDIWFQWIAPD